MRPTISEQLSQCPISESGAFLAMKEAAEEFFAGNFNGPGEAVEQVLKIVQAGAQVVEIAVERQRRELFSHS